MSRSISSNLRTMASKRARWRQLYHPIIFVFLSRRSLCISDYGRTTISDSIFRYISICMSFDRHKCPNRICSSLLILIRLFYPMEACPESSGRTTAGSAEGQSMIKNWSTPPTIRSMRFPIFRYGRTNNKFGWNISGTRIG